MSYKYKNIQTTTGNFKFTKTHNFVFQFYPRAAVHVVCTHLFAMYESVKERVEAFRNSTHRMKRSLNELIILT